MPKLSSTALPCSFFVNVPEFSSWWLLFKEGDFFREIEEKFACNIQLRISHISTKTRNAT